MEDRRVTAEEIKAAMAADVDALAEQIAAAMNAARDGAIIPDSEIPVRDAHAEFRQQAYQKAVGLVQQKHEAFSPSADGDAEPGPADDNVPDR